MSDPIQRIGPYKLLRILGEGGMGVVYEAEQVEPVRRRVALKVLKTGMDTRAFIARFEVERQALAVMEHANIARVLDAGEADGRPFYVMELVSGVALTEFCDDHRLSVAERLTLFSEVCGAVQHAHQKGIIHRDLKPSNILVTMQDDRPIPKVIDFGIAKAIGQPLTDKTLVTRFGDPMGTPAYMSPEQWDSQAGDIDTRTDIYSLGVVLFQLLTGKLPYTTEELLRIGNAAPFMLRHRTPPTPTGILASAEAGSETAAYMRSTDPRSLMRELRGDLDWIACKAIDPDRTRRYATAHEFAQDVVRHLKSEPVVARPPSAGYRAGRFIARHRVGVSVAAAAVLALIAFATVTAVQAQRIQRERDRAAGEAAKSKALNAFLQETLLSPDPMGGIGKDATMLQALDSATSRLSREHLASPAVEASVKSAIGWAYFNLGSYPKAEPLLASALSIRRTLSPPDSEGLAESLTRNAQLDEKLGRHSRAAEGYAAAVGVGRNIGGDTSRALATTLVGFGGFARDRGDTARALKLLGEAATIYSKANDSAGRAEVENQLGVLEYQRGNLDMAARYMQSSLDYYRRKLGRHPFVAETLTNLGVVLEDLRRPAEAERAYREALDIAHEKLGPDHDLVGAMTNNLAGLLANRGEFDASKPLLREALAIDERKLGPNNPVLAPDVINLAKSICRGSGDYKEGELERWTGVSWQSVGNLTHECHHPEVEVEGSLWVAGFADDNPDYGFASNANGPIVIFTGLLLVHQWGMHVAIAQGRPYEAFAATWSDGKEYPWNMLHVISPIPAGGSAQLNGGWGHYVNYSISNDVAIAGDASAWYAVTRQQNFLFVKKGYYSAATNSGVTVDIADGFSGGGGPVLPEISVYSGQPTVSWLEATQSQIWVARYDGTQWRLLGQGDVASGYIGHIRQDVLGSNLYVMQVNSAGTPRLFISRWDGLEWAGLPDPAGGDTPMATTGDVAIMNSGPVVAYVTGGVMKVKQLR